jgi:hypothetical protein
MRTVSFPATIGWLVLDPQGGASMCRKIFCLVLLACSVVACAHAGDATVDSVKVTKIFGIAYEVEFSGSLSLTDTGGGYEQWYALTVTVSQKGMAAQTAGVSSLTPPTLKAKGSYVAKTTVFSNVMDPDWSANATAEWYKDAMMNMGSKKGTKAFTVP